MIPYEPRVKAYTLSTCGWCKKTKELLDALDIEFEYVDVDTLSGDELEAVKQEVARYNPQVSFPTLVIDEGRKVIVGFKSDEISRCLE